eukprot:4477868-Pleurochrysis_carterae.AAC.2
MQHREGPHRSQWRMARPPALLYVDALTNSARESQFTDTEEIHLRRLKDDTSRLTTVRPQFFYVKSSGCRKVVLS